jgi:coenzyme F420-reducing hydrogenase beta subunit
MQVSFIAHSIYSPLIGYYTDVFLSCATDYEIRFSASSGGSLTALLIYILDKELVDQVIVALPNENDPLYAKARAIMLLGTN